MKLVKPIVLLSCAVALCFSLPLMTRLPRPGRSSSPGSTTRGAWHLGPKARCTSRKPAAVAVAPEARDLKGTRCYGETGVISRYELRSGNVTDVVTGLPSLATEEGQMFAIGPNDLSLQGRGNLFFTIGVGGNPTAREDLFGPRRRETGATSDAQRRMAAGAC